ncbi:MAG: YeeE/YedE family protein [Prolixibacteraceae bacterium]|nr:YeeE/YedE family protein [Prolixibacteraceae bacterium]MBN2773906.1 YeeE/YedE family protein [Prolixibacteraceae bacterium]
MGILTLVFGFLFGTILQKAMLNKFDTISGMATLEDLTVAKAIMVAIGVGAVILNIEIGAGLAAYHVKPFIFGGIVLGGLIFGIGMAILGYCPGTLAVSLGEGSTDALAGIIGGLFGGLIYTLSLPSIQGVLGPDLGAISLFTLTGKSKIVFYLLVFLFGIVMTGGAFLLNKADKTKNYRWLYAGIAFAVLNGIVFLISTSNRPIGASTTYPYVADLLTGTIRNGYFEKIKTPGSWELIFLTGAMLAGLVFSILSKEFKIIAIHERWAKYKGTSTLKRIIFAFIGGFILIFGARMAGGCTSGHVISGGMQIAISSLVFAIFVFAGLLVTGKIFYRKN